MTTKNLFEKTVNWLLKLQERVSNLFNRGRRYSLIFPDRIIDLRGASEQLVQHSTTAETLEGWLLFAFVLYLIGLLGRVCNQKNFIVTRRSVEIMYLGIITSFVVYGNTRNDPRGSIYGLLLLILAACESAVGLGLRLALHRFGHSVSFKDYQELGG